MCTYSACANVDAVTHQGFAPSIPNQSTIVQSSVIYYLEGDEKELAPSKLEFYCDDKSTKLNVAQAIVEKPGEETKTYDKLRSLLPYGITREVQKKFTVKSSDLTLSGTTLTLSTKLRAANEW